jgi:hypothetical protein
MRRRRRQGIAAVLGRGRLISPAGRLTAAPAVDRSRNDRRENDPARVARASTNAGERCPRDARLLPVRPAGAAVVRPSAGPIAGVWPCRPVIRQTAAAPSIDACSLCDAGRRVVHAAKLTGQLSVGRKITHLYQWLEGKIYFQDIARCVSRRQRPCFLVVARRPYRSQDEFIGPLAGSPAPVLSFSGIRRRVSNDRLRGRRAGWCVPRVPTPGKASAPAN